MGTVHCSIDEYVEIDNEHLDDLAVINQDALKAVRDLRLSSSPGPDGVTSQFLMRYSQGLAPVSRT
jgi:hypothetical protein